MPAATTVLRVRDLGPKKLAALRRNAVKEGLTPEQYVKRLIEERLDIAERARSQSFDELAKPFREAFKDVSEEELDAIVDAARTRHHQRRKRAKRR